MREGRKEGELNQVCFSCSASIWTNLPLSVAEDDGLCDGESVVEITESVKLPLLLLYCHKELLQLITAQREGRGRRSKGKRGERERKVGREGREGENSSIWHPSFTRNMYATAETAGLTV